MNEDNINLAHILPFSSNAAAINPANIVNPIIIDRMIRMMFVIMIMLFLMFIIVIKIKLIIEMIKVERLIKLK